MSTQGSTSPATATQIAPGVRQVSVGAPFRSHVYLIDGPLGPIAFDAGIKDSGPEILAAAGGHLERVILSHSHTSTIAEASVSLARLSTAIPTRSPTSKATLAAATPTSA